ncbi:HIT domain-containing protein [Cognatilysobacter lacus]|uniref:HIT domain-containing protein n=1 Tax=Cognatilysobacter lacus TaxID=1643323 RepID=A0A5D8Z674_9GAMM|nr:HIT family protein [Lysobacter lacus]TZF90160.1 HIT domain-containing protein [Lysobacter lacus]
MSRWALDSRLDADTHLVGALSLCDVRLMDDNRFPWLILVPRIVGATEWIDLDRQTQHRLADEITLASQALRTLCSPSKLNVATLGNIVAQLHVHVIARFHEDAAWPRPVWGVGSALPYPADESSTLLARLRAALAL